MSLRRRGLLGLAALTALGGCGFQPIYMPTATDAPGVAQRELAAINVALIPDRPGQLLREALQQRLHGAGGMAAPRYTLTVAYWISGEGIGVLPTTIPTRIRLFAHANWTLVGDDPARTRITAGYTRAEDDYNMIDQQYFAADLSNEAVDRRLADEVAGEIVTRLAIFFRDHARPAAGS